MRHPRAYIPRSWDGGHNLIVVADEKPGSIKIATGFEWREAGEAERFDPQEGIPRADELIQRIVDQAWEAGFRPTGYSDVKNETAAIREHLNDMRTVAFHKLGIKPGAS